MNSEIPPSERLSQNSDPLQDKVIAALKDCYDPEIPVNIFELGLIYDIDIHENKHVDLLMTLTSPMCPVAESLPHEVEEKVNAIPEINSTKVELTWEPPWSPEKMSEAAKLQLNL
ncbi:MAG: SUF system Fe-S cluster assembly protein [Deltaproteobacteria bacterium]|nr:SUF system Fe-S cluster assembly protein [Deltaproteobacteria bacterium]